MEKYLARLFALTIFVLFTFISYEKGLPALSIAQLSAEVTEEQYPLVRNSEFCWNCTLAKPFEIEDTDLLSYLRDKVVSLPELFGYSAE
jgi:hypothetical protein